jgi:predicted small integral membrane protein
VFEDPADHIDSAKNRPTAGRGWRSVSVRGKRRGFLPFDTNPFDRVFVSVILLVAIHLLWMRFLEEYITLTVATILTLVLAVIIFLRG